LILHKGTVTAMRLIDVDAFKSDYGMADECKDCKTAYRVCDFDRDYSRMDFCWWLDDAPTVDAIPIDWINLTEYVYCAVNDRDEIQWVTGSSSKTRYFRTDKYLKKAVEYHNTWHGDDIWRVAKFALNEVWYEEEGR